MNLRRVFAYLRGTEIPPAGDPLTFEESQLGKAELEVDPDTTIAEIKDALGVDRDSSQD